MKQKGLIAITGASSGIGKAIAEKFASEGHPLLLMARRVEKMQEMGLSHALIKQVDVTKAEELKQAIAEGEAKYGPVECLINNAGVMLLGDPATQPAEEWQKMYDVNVLGLLNGVQSVLPAMKDRKSGTIVNIGSVAGKKPLANHSVYCGTKFAVHAMTETMRMELSQSDVRFITVAPGATESELISHTTSEDIRQGYQDWKSSIGGAIRAEDVANSVFFAYSQPQNVCIREIVLAPTRQEP
jgi:NADP-dependent 3-hydroxy acid dehydrogenase YdfG